MYLVRIIRITIISKQSVISKIIGFLQFSVSKKIPEDLKRPVMIIEPQ